MRCSTVKELASISSIILYLVELKNEKMRNKRDGQMKKIEREENKKRAISHV